MTDAFHINRHLFQEVFDWAGELRTVNFGKGGSRFATARYLDATLDTLFTELASRNYLRSRTGERFAEGAAHHISELNVAHPFRERNGRTMRLHLSQLAEQAGHALDVSRIAGPAWIEASIRGFEGDERPLASLIAGALAPARWLRPNDARDTPRDAGLTIMAALRGPAPKDGAPWDAAPTPMAARLAEYEARRAAEAAAKAAASPAAAPDPAPMAPAQPKPGRDPGPGF